MDGSLLLVIEGDHSCHSSLRRHNIVPSVCCCCRLQGYSKRPAILSGLVWSYLILLACFNSLTFVLGVRILGATQKSRTFRT